MANSSRRYNLWHCKCRISVGCDVIRGHGRYEKEVSISWQVLHMSNDEQVSQFSQMLSENH